MIWKNKAIDNTKLFILLLALAAGIASGLRNPKLVELYPCSMSEGDQVQVEHTLSGNGFLVSKTDGRVLVEEKDICHAQVLLIQYNLHLEPDPDRLYNWGTSETELTSAERLAIMEATVQLLPGVNYATIAIPDRTYFCDPERPVIVGVNCERKLDFSTLSGLASYLRMHGEERFEIRYLP